jgi:hypothetical protein
LERWLNGRDIKIPHKIAFVQGTGPKKAYSQSLCIVLVRRQLVPRISTIANFSITSIVDVSQYTLLVNFTHSESQLPLEPAIELWLTLLRLMSAYTNCDQCGQCLRCDNALLCKRHEMVRWSSVFKTKPEFFLAYLFITLLSSTFLMVVSYVQVYI